MPIQPTSLEDILSSLEDTKDKHDSPWLLTLRHSPHLQQALPSDDYSLGSALYEVQIGSDSSAQVVATSKDIFDSWTGRRWLNGTEYHGPIYNFATSSLYTGDRSCKCSTCEAHMPSHRRAN